MNPTKNTRPASDYYTDNQERVTLYPEDGEDVAVIGFRVTQANKTAALAKFQELKALCIEASVIGHWEGVTSEDGSVAAYNIRCLGIMNATEPE